jgi:hypothetical protein
MNPDKKREDVAKKTIERLRKFSKRLEGYQYLVGRLCITPFEDVGLVLIREVLPQSDGTWIARGSFVGEHPNGYEDKSIASYYASELIPTVLVCDTDGNFVRDC